MTLQGCFAGWLVQLVGWQHWAGTQSSFVVHTCSPGGVAGREVTTGEGVGTGVTAGEPAVHPANATVAIQRRMRAIAVAFISKRIGPEIIKPGAGAGVYCRLYQDLAGNGFV
jgi:hypothetical protein